MLLFLYCRLYKLLEQSGWISCLNDPLPIETSDTLSTYLASVYTLQQDKKEEEEALAAAEAMAAAAAAANADKGRKIRDVRELFGGNLLQ